MDDERDDTRALQAPRVSRERTPHALEECKKPSRTRVVIVCVRCQSRGGLRVRLLRLCLRPRLALHRIDNPSLSLLHSLPTMSLSPSESTSMHSDQGASIFPNGAHKRKRTSFSSAHDSGPGLHYPDVHPVATNPGPPGHSPLNGSNGPSAAPKRGARACTACRKGKNRCEGEVSHA